jgi:hypothetical protein
MAYIIAISAILVTGFIVEWAQRRCEAWAYIRDKDL